MGTRLFLWHVSKNYAFLFVHILTIFPNIYNDIFKKNNQDNE